MSSSKLNAISPLDGRYREKVNSLAEYFSEKALIKFRIKVEIEYFISLCNIPLKQLEKFDRIKFDSLRSIYKNFNDEDAEHIKKLEQKTNHDVKAVEYFLREKFTSIGISQYKEFIHFGLTSQDINNTAIPLSLKLANKNIYIPKLELLIKNLSKLSKDWKNIPMLARTHGQPASPTRLGKEIEVFITRLNQQLKILRKIPFAAKFGGATGNFNAHFVAYPNVKWKNFSKNFVEKKLGLYFSFPTTQIEHYDHMASLFDTMKRINSIIIDMNRDFWTYISMDYFKQKIKPGEVGSSAMPHKVNPIDFENSEGNLGIANAILEHLAAKLPISRLQRDLTDSTVMRNIGVPYAHSIISIDSTIKGLKKLVVNLDKINNDLNENWAVVAEAIQTILRKEGYPNPYEALKNLTRVKSMVNSKSIINFIDGLEVSDSIKNELKAITPFNYTGIK
ncbi:MAG: adenylosuccinate lyase [Flavobacteriaceae bacterium]|nr:adenylosuccinate lyase [Flavobacteriaceae bacterium]